MISNRQLSYVTIVLCLICVAGSFMTVALRQAGRAETYSAADDPPSWPLRPIEPFEMKMGAFIHSPSIRCCTAGYFVDEELVFGIDYSGAVRYRPLNDWSR